MKRLASSLVMTLAASLAAGCETPGSNLCDPGQILDPVSGYCVAAPADGGADTGTQPSPDASAGAADAAGDASCSPGTSMFGDPCTTLSDCHCPTDYCAVTPGATMGVCTRTGCDVDGSICPSAYTCLDLGQFQAGLPSVCFK